MAKKKTNRQATTSEALRQRAEELLRARPKDVASWPAADGQRLVHELQVHQIELELQNEDLRQAQLELSASRDRYADLFEHDLTGDYVARPDGTLVLCNSAFARIFGFADPQAAVGANLSDLLGPADSWIAHVARVKRHRRLERREGAACRRDGSPLHIVETIVGIFDERGELVELQGYVFDDTERKQAESWLHQSEERFRKVFEHAATGIAVMDRQGRFLRCNPAYCALLGYREEEFRQLEFAALVPPEGREANLAEIRRLLAGELSYFEIQTRYLHKDGRAIWVHMVVSLLPNDAGRPSHIMALVTDITARKQAEEAAKQFKAELERQVVQRTAESREREERLAAFMRTSFNSMVTIDQRGMITDANPATERMFGYSREELVGQNVAILMPPPYRDEHDGYIRRYLETGQARVVGASREVVGRRKDGSTFPLEISVGEIDHLGLFSGILRDISEYRELQKHILEIAAEEHRRIGQELHDGTGQELTGLSLLAGALSDALCAGERQEDDQRTTWTVDDEQFQRLKHLASRLSQGLSEAGRHVAELACGIMPVQIDAEGLESALTELAATISVGNNIDCRVECRGQVEVANNTTATHLYRIAQEALHNAVRHGQARRIVLSLVQNDQETVLGVHDNGIGFDPATSRTTGPGSGMGLRTMAYRSSLIGGALLIDRQADGGTSVRCAVPRGGG